MADSDSSEKSPERWQDITIRIAVPAAAISAVVHEVWKSFPDWALTVVLFLAVFAILVKIEQIFRSIQAVQEQLKEINADYEKIISIVDRDMHLTEGVRQVLADHAQLRIYDTYEDFYREMRNSAENARQWIRASYMRRFPPASLGGEAVRFFESAVEWARRDSRHVLRRVVCKPEGKLLPWVQDQDSKSRVQGSHYSIRILDWTVHEVDAVSVAIIDDDLVFFVFSEQEDSMKGFSIKNKNVGSFFIEYHNQIWQKAVPFEEFIKK